MEGRHRALTARVRDKITDGGSAAHYNCAILFAGGEHMSMEKKRRQAVVDERACVACGCCVKVCPLRAIEVVRGVAARVDADKCVGCGKCARECPASVIEIREASS